LLRRISVLTVVAVLLSLAVRAETVRTTSRLNLRQEPTTASPRIVLLPAGRELEVISRSGLWIRVRTGGNEGWVHSDYVVDAALTPGDWRRPADPATALRDAELSRDVALLRVEQLEKAARSALAEEGEPSAATEAEGAEVAGQEARLRAELTAALGALAERDDRIEGLEAALAERRQAEARLEVEMREARELAVDLEAESVRLRRELTDAETREASGAERLILLEEEQSRTAALEQRVAELAATEERLRQLLQTAESGLAAASDWQRQAADSSSEASGLREELARLTFELETLRSTSVGADELAAVVSERDRLATTVATLEEEASERDSAAAEREAHIEQLEARLVAQAELEAELEATRDQLALVGGERDRSASTVDDLESESRRLAEALSELQERSGRAQEEIERLRSENNLLAGQAAELSSEMSLRQEQLLLEVQQAESEARQAAARTSDLEAEVARLGAELAEAAAGESALRGLLTAAVGARGRAEADLEEARVRLRDAERAGAAAVDLRGQLAAAQAARDQAVESLVETESRLQTAERERSAAADLARALGREVGDLSSELSATESRQASLMERLAALEEEASVEPRSRVPVPAAADLQVADDVIATIRAWARAWSSQDVAGYLAMYATEFRPPAGMARETWEAQRRQRLSLPAFIEVQVGNLDVNLLAADRAAVRFIQAYRSNTMSDRVAKTLRLAREDDGWKIVSEESEPIDG
jgi:chromosome segregation ATPase